MRSKLIGSTLMVIGSSVGAGMLALPILGAPLGFLQTVTLLICFWILMTITALLTLKVNLAMPDDANSFSTMAERTLGKCGKVVAWLACLFLLYLLSAAFISGSASLLFGVFHSIGLHVAEPICAFIFVIGLGAVVFYSTSAVDRLNRVLIAINAALLLVVVFSLIPHVNLTSLINQQNTSSLKYLGIAAPILLCLFGFHSIIPSIRGYVGNKPRELKLVIVAGTTITLIVYLLWLVVTLGAVGHLSLNISAADFIDKISAITDSKLVSVGIRGFGNLIMVSSFLGVALGLFNFLADGFKRPNTRIGRMQTAMLTFVPPLLLALFYHKGFIMALGYAAFFLIVLFVILPILMALALPKYSQHREQF